ncbi:LATE EMBRYOGENESIS ABUNDANT PROTEIN [Salix koriyanagi]|uniref:LATE EMBRYOGENESIS ABUNDANT PROTEIN n=1 Tax=Salix koriyanagi TaxID=2511006 RepID=A0A9Q0T5Y4_9ROSI|nr:LATE EMBRYOGENESIS ABUNDANT PROTEIN [Salix koriyanagi]
MAEREQAKPLAPAAFQIRSDEDENMPAPAKSHRRNCIKCCGCITAIFLILATTIVVLVLTVFQVEDPVIRMNNVSVQRLEFANGTLRADVNVTLVADVSVKNPNAATFKFNNGTTTVYCGGMVVGEANTPPGKAKARRTLHMNVTVDLIPSKLLAVPGLMSDILSVRKLNVSSNTVIGGKVRILQIIKKYIVVRVNCTVTYNFASQAIQGGHCKPHLSI